MALYFLAVSKVLCAWQLRDARLAAWLLCRGATIRSSVVLKYEAARVVWCGALRGWQSESIEERVAHTMYVPRNPFCGVQGEVAWRSVFDLVYDVKSATTKVVNGVGSPHAQCPRRWHCLHVPIGRQKTTRLRRSEAGNAGATRALQAVPEQRRQYDQGR